MLILASFSTNLMPPALPDMEKAGAAAPAATGAAAGAAAAGVFGFNFNCIDFTLFDFYSLENAISLQSLDDLHELAFGQGKLRLDGIDVYVSACLLDIGHDLLLDLV